LTYSRRWYIHDSMKNSPVVKIGSNVEQEVLRILRGSPFLEVEVEPASAGASRPDAIFVDGDGRTLFAIEFKSHVGPESARSLVSRRQPDSPGHFLLVSREISPGAQRILVEGGIDYLDAAGSVHLGLPRSFVHVEAPPQKKADAPRPKVVGKAAIIGELLLLEPGKDWRVGEAAVRCGISIGLAHKVLANLESVGILASHGSGPSRRRRLVDAPALLDRLAEDDGAVRSWPLGAFRLFRSALETARDISQRLEQSGVGHAITGAAAVSILAPVLTTVPAVEIRLAAAVPIDSALETSGCRRVETGANVLFVQEQDDSGLAFRRNEQGMWVANAVRVYLDVLRDPRRGQEQADLLRSSLLGG
jgi:hypothetical protein